jgi:hypothetical protein
MLRDSVVASATLAVAVTAAFALFGQIAIGLGIGAGLLLGSANGFAIQAFVARDTPFLAASMFRLVTLSALGVLLAVVFGISAWPVMIGVASAQLVMVGAGVRQGLRA